MIRILTCIALAAAGWLAIPAPVQAAQSYDNCTGFISSLPATITTQGTWCLNKDVSTSMSSGNAITFATNNVTLDCNHFKIGGLGGGAGTITAGVSAESRLNATVRNCNIRGFFFGLYFDSGGGHLVEGNSLDGNTYIALFVSSPGSTIRNNLVIDTGGSTHLTGNAYAIYARYGVDILDNTVNGVAPTPTGANASAYGIWTEGILTEGDGGGSVSGNRVRGLASAGIGTPIGIVTLSSSRSVISGNHLQGPGVAGGTGVYCDSNTATAVLNVIVGFATAINNCHASSNFVNPN